MNREQLIYDLSLSYAQEFLRRMSDVELKDIAQHGDKIYSAFEMAHDYFEETLPSDT